MMELFEQILCEAIAKEAVPSLHIDSVKLVEMKCYQTIQKISEIIADEALDDPECFWRIEQIICALEELEIGCRGRHDFWCSCRPG